jgi:hypothetical protein
MYMPDIYGVECVWGCGKHLIYSHLRRLSPSGILHCVEWYIITDLWNALRLFETTVAVVIATEIIGCRIFRPEVEYQGLAF